MDSRYQGKQITVKAHVLEVLALQQASLGFFTHTLVHPAEPSKHSVKQRCAHVLANNVDRNPLCRRGSVPYAPACSAAQGTVS